MSRQQQLQEMLDAEPDDPFLHYALALEQAKGDERPAGLKRLADMNVRFPDHVPAYFRLGQLLAEDGETEAASRVLRQGLQAAGRTGNDHAAAEMRELLESL